MVKSESMYVLMSIAILLFSQLSFFFIFILQK